jgi:hypothetical protein
MQCEIVIQGSCHLLVVGGCEDEIESIQEGEHVFVLVIWKE